MNFDLTRRRFLKITGTSTILAVTAPTVAARILGENQVSNILWSIGTVDLTSDEFSGGEKLRIYDVNVDKDPKRWSRTQGAGEPSRISFSLDEVLPAVFAIEGFMMSHAPNEVYITINGKKGRFRIIPKYKKDADMHQGRELTHNGFSLRVPIHSSFLKKGVNEISIIAVGTGVFHYDSLWMERAVKPIDTGLALSVEPTIFYRNRNSQLFEEVDFIARHNLPLGKLSFTFQLGAHTVVSNLKESSMADFGEYSVMMAEVPVSDKPESYTLIVKTDKGKNRTTDIFKPEKRWKLFAGLKIHNDIGFTDYQQNVEELDARNTDLVLEFVNKFPGYKFNLEVAWLADNYTRLRTSPRVEELMKLVRDNRVGIGAFYLNLPTSVCDGEELYRALYVSANLRRAHNVQVDTACLVDIPSQCWSVPSYLADAGVKGFAIASNQHRGPLLMYSNLNENSPFYWEGPDGKRVISFFSRSYRNADRLFSASPTLDKSRQGIIQVLARYRREDYAPDAFYVFGQTGDNATMRDSSVKAIIDWNAVYEYPKFIFATDTDYFDYIEKNFADKLPVFRGDGGAYWADAVGSSTAPTILNRNTQRLLPAAEMFLSFASLFDKNLAYPDQKLRDAWEDLMFYDEHTWGAHNSITQPDRENVLRQFEFKQAHAVRAHWAAKDLLTHAFARLTQFISIKDRTLFVFNPTLHTRSDLVTIDINDTQQLIDNVTKKEVTGEILLEKNRFCRLRFLAKDVPGMGYKTYEIIGEELDVENLEDVVMTEKAVTTRQKSSSSWEIESRFYRVVFDRKTGGIVSLIDKELKRELVDPNAPHGLNELVYVAGGEDQQIERNVSSVPPTTRLDVSGQNDARLLENIATPFGRCIRIRSRAKNVPVIESEIIIYDTLKRIDIRNRISKEEIRSKEAIYFAFPFRSAASQFQYQVQNAWADPNLDQLPGSNREWFATQNLVLSRDGNTTVALATPDFPLVSLTDINRGKWPKKLNLLNGHIYSYVTNNYWSVNIKASQSGELEFHYYITSGKDLDNDSLARFDAQTRSDLIPYSRYERRYERGPSQMPIDQGSFFYVDAPHVEISAFKEAEDKNGCILRLRETSGRDGTALLKSEWFNIDQAWLTNGVEDNISDLTPIAGELSVPLKACRFTTVRLCYSLVTRQKQK